MSGILESRYGAEVYVNTNGDVLIKQKCLEEYLFGGQDPFIRFRPEEIDGLIALLKEAQAEAIDFVPEDDEE
jgi:hypothetical protein